MVETTSSTEKYRRQVGRKRKYKEDRARKERERKCAKCGITRVIHMFKSRTGKLIHTCMICGVKESAKDQGLATTKKRCLVIQNDRDKAGGILKESCDNVDAEAFPESSFLDPGSQRSILLRQLKNIQRSLWEERQTTPSQFLLNVREAEELRQFFVSSAYTANAANNLRKDFEEACKRRQSSIAESTLKVNTSKANIDAGTFSKLAAPEVELHLPFREAKAENALSAVRPTPHTETQLPLRPATSAYTAGSLMPTSHVAFQLPLRPAATIEIPDIRAFSNIHQTKESGKGQAKDYSKLFASAGRLALLILCKVDDPDVLEDIINLTTHYDPETLMNAAFLTPSWLRVLLS